MPTRIFIWDTVDDCVLQETDETGATLVTYTRESGAFGPLVSQQRSGETSYYHFDALGSTRLLTDDSQNITDTYLADAWGNDVATTGSTANAYRWIGRLGYQYDSSLMAYYVFTSVYSPAEARWIVLIAALPGANAYVYIMSAPLAGAGPAKVQKNISVTSVEKTPPELAADACNTAPKFKWTTQWKFIPANMAVPAGYIIQKVHMNFKASTCDGSELAGLKNAACTNEDICKANYAELWEVAMGGVVAPSNNDTFGHFGYTVPTRGIFQTKGEAYFINASQLTKGEVDWLNNNVKSGKTGAKPACQLRSICDPNSPVFADILAKGHKGGAKASTKLANRKWNCCPCENNFSSLEMKVDNGASITIKGEGNT